MILRGAAVGFTIFLVELVLLLRAQAVGLAIDIKGPMKLLLDASGGQLAWLATRIVLTYVVGFALLGLCARVLQWATGVRRAGGMFAALVICIVLRRAIETPALFDDLPGVTAPLTWLVDHGQPYALEAIFVAALVLVALRRRTLPRLAVVAFFVALSFCRLPSLRAKPEPLIVLFGVDAMRPDRLHVTPAIKAFSEEATLFTRAYTPIAATDAAWRSLLTARYPYQHGVRYGLTSEKYQDTHWDTFARAFDRAGWGTTFATDCSRFHFETAESGFARRLQPPRGAVNFLAEKLRFRFLPMLDLGFVPELTQNRGLAGMYSARQDAERLAHDVVAQAKAGKSLWAFHSTAAHFPGDPQYPFYLQKVSTTEPLDRRLRMHFAPIEKKARETQKYPTNEALYDELLAQADMQFAALRASLEHAGLWEQATVVVFSDHGEDFYEDRPELRGELSVHGALLNATQSQIVLAIKTPGSKPQTIDQLVRLIDVGPTLLDVAGLPALEGVPGRSLLPLMRGETLPPAPLVAETAFTHASPDVFNPEHYTGAPRTFEAYDLRADGSVAVKDAVHAEIMKEKDFGVFDGERWLIHWRDKSGATRLSCSLEPCAPLEGLLPN